MVILSYILLIIAVAGAGIALVITHTALILGSLLFIFSLFLIGALVKRLNKFNTKIRIFLDAVEDKENMILFNEQSADTVSLKTEMSLQEWCVWSWPMRNGRKPNANHFHPR